MDAFTPQLPILETVARATVVYLFVCLTLRVIPKRHAGSISPSDIVGAVIVGGLAVEAMRTEKAKPADLVLMMLIVLGWNFVLDLVGDRFPFLRRWLREAPTRLVRDGHIDRRALRKEMLTVDELMAQLRKEGVADVSNVAAAYLEADGHVSVIPKDAAPPPTKPPRKRGKRR